MLRRYEGRWRARAAIRAGDCILPVFEKSLLKYVLTAPYSLHQFFRRAFKCAGTGTRTPVRISFFNQGQATGACQLLIIR